MPRNPSSGTRYLLKRRRPGVSLAQTLWSGRYRGQEVELVTWAGVPVEKDAKAAKAQAITILRRFLTAVEKKEFDPKGEQPVLGDNKLTLKVFIDGEWKTWYAKRRDMTVEQIDETPFATMLGVISNSRLGRYTMEDLAGASKDIEAWLDAEATSREWIKKTWNDYRDTLNRICKQAVRLDRMAVNPLDKIDRKLGVEQPELFKERHLLEDVEDRLFAACELLNRPQHCLTTAKITQAHADQIRTQLAAGVLGVTLAKTYGVSPAIISQIKHWDIWNPRKTGTRGTEMKRRLIGAFDGGLRASEMLDVTIDDVNWRLQTQKAQDGTRLQWYLITLQAWVTKGGKRTGEKQYIHAATERFRNMLTARRFQLKDNPPNQRHIWGNEDGSRPVSFKRQWRDLFTLARLDWGRNKGLTWHTGRHEFISRLAEKNGENLKVVQEGARHRRMETTEKYMHARRDAVVAAVAGLER